MDPVPSRCFPSLWIQNPYSTCFSLLKITLLVVGILTCAQIGVFGTLGSLDAGLLGGGLIGVAFLLQCITYMKRKREADREFDALIPIPTFEKFIELYPAFKEFQGAKIIYGSYFVSASGSQNSGEPLNNANQARLKDLLDDMRRSYRKFCREPGGGYHISLKIILPGNEPVLIQWGDEEYELTLGE